MAHKLISNFKNLTLMLRSIFLSLSVIFSISIISAQDIGKRKLEYKKNRIKVSTYLTIKNIIPLEYGCGELYFDSIGEFENYSHYEIGDNIYTFGNIKFKEHFASSEFYPYEDVLSLEFYSREVNGWGYHMSETEGIFFLSNTFWSDTLSYKLYNPDELTTINPFCAYSPWKKLKQSDTAKRYSKWSVHDTKYTKIEFQDINYTQKPNCSIEDVLKLAQKSFPDRNLKKESLQLMPQAQELKIILTLKNGKTITYYLTTETRTGEC